jgi:hypothetical protein
MVTLAWPCGCVWEEHAHGGRGHGTQPKLPKELL